MQRSRPNHVFDRTAAGANRPATPGGICVLPKEYAIHVAQSLGGFTAPIVCDLVPVTLLMLVAGMVPRPGESAGEWWEQADPVFGEPWPLDASPDVPTRFLLCRDDRFFPAAFQRRVVQERLGFVPDEMDGGHLPALARPDELVERLERYRNALG